MSASMKVEVGDIAMTPFEPHGLVKVLSIEPSWWPGHDEVALVEHLHDHYGYPKGNRDYYFRSELKRTDVTLEVVVS